MSAIDFRKVHVSDVTFRKTNERVWKTRYLPTLEVIDHSSYTARGFCLMGSRCVDTLHLVALALGIPRGFFNSKKGVYLISNNKRKQAIKAGAQDASNEASVRPS